MKQKIECSKVQQVSAPKKIEPWTPRIQEAFGNLLILNSFSGDPTCTFGPWPPCGKEGQRVTLRIESPGAETLLVRSDEAITDEEAKEGVSSSLRRSWFEALAPNSEIGVSAEIALCGDEGSVVEFPVRFYSLMKIDGLNRAEFNEEFNLFESPYEHDLGNGLTIRTSSYGMRPTARASRNALPNPDPNWGEGCFYLENCAVRFQFTTPVSFFSFSLVRDPRSSKSRYNCKEVGIPLGRSVYLPDNGGITQPSTQVVIESVRGIEYVVVEQAGSADMMYIDNVLWAV